MVISTHLPPPVMMERTAVLDAVTKTVADQVCAFENENWQRRFLRNEPHLSATKPCALRSQVQNYAESAQGCLPRPRR